MAEFYATGTVSVSNGGTTVTGSGVLWSTVLAGDTLELAGQRVTIAAAPESPYTSLELTAAWTGTTQSGASYTIRYDAPSRFTAAYMAVQVRALVAKAAIIEASRPSYGVVSVGSNTPPGSPVTNDMYVVGTSPTGAWSGQANALAQWTGSAWQFTAPEGGTTAVSAATNATYIFSGTAWNAYVAPSSFIATLMDDADEAAARTTLGAFAASGVSGYGATLIDDADAAEAQETLGISAYVSTLLDAADAAAARTTLGMTTIGSDLVTAADAAAARVLLGGTALRSLGTLTGAAGSFARFTGTGATDAAMQAIVGTVSQSSGTPTGAIIETGTGTNGRFIKFADGTLICWGSADLSTNNINTAWAGGFRSALIGIILPAAFVGSAIMSAWMSGAAMANGWISGTVVNADTATGGVYASRVSTATSQSVIVDFIAIGRWF